MSPWRDQVRLFLCPGRLVAVRLAQGLRPRVLCKETYVAEEGAADAAALLAGVPEVLRDPKWQKADAAVLLSSRFAHYQLLPWTDASLDRAEEEARVRHLYARAHGEAAASLELRASPGGFGAASVVSGVEQRLVTDLREAFAASSLRLRSVQPYLMAAFNQCRRELARGARWFVVAESGTLCTALVAGGRWRSLRMRRVGADWGGELATMLRRQALADEGWEQVTDVVIHAADGDGASWPRQDGWNFRKLELPSPAEAA